MQKMHKNDTSALIFQAKGRSLFSTEPHFFFIPLPSSDNEHIEVSLLPQPVNKRQPALFSTHAHNCLCISTHVHDCAWGACVMPSPCESLALMEGLQVVSKSPLQGLSAQLELCCLLHHWPTGCSVNNRCKCAVSLKTESSNRQMRNKTCFCFKSRNVTRRLRIYEGQSLSEMVQIMQRERSDHTSEVCAWWLILLWVQLILSSLKGW